MAPPPTPAAEDERVRAQARRIQELEARLAERTRILTDANRALAQQIQRRDELQATLFQAQKLEAMVHLVGGYAHDLRNLVGVMSSYFSLIARSSHQPDVPRWALSGRRSGEQAVSLIQHMLDYMRPRAAQTETLWPAVWLEEQGDLLRHAAGPTVDVRLNADAATWPVRVDEHRLSSALINLAINARDAMPEGGTLEVCIANVPAGSPRPDRLGAGDHVLLAVVDSGLGMSPEVLAQATQPMFTTKAPGQGTGLGLAMVKAFVASSGGALQLSSTPGAGTRIEMWLPRAVATSQHETPSPAQPERNPDAAEWAEPATIGSAQPAVQILYVDDDDSIRGALAQRLRAAGWEVFEADGPEVAQAFIHSIPRLGAVVLSLSETGSDAAGLLQRLWGIRPGLPAVVFADWSEEGLPRHVARLRKPVDPATLISTVQDQIRVGAIIRQADPSYLDRLLVRMKAQPLIDAVCGWRDARGAGLLPDLASVQRVLAGQEHWTFLAEPLEGTPDTAFRFVTVGVGLEQQLGQALSGQTVAGTELGDFVALGAAYRRAMKHGLPSYEYARYALGDAPPVIFERLILPAAQDGRTLSHLMGIATFTNLPPPSESSLS